MARTKKNTHRTNEAMVSTENTTPDCITGKI